MRTHRGWGAAPHDSLDDRTFRWVLGCLLVGILLLATSIYMGLTLPADWEHHEGRSLPGTARTTKIEEGVKSVRYTFDVADQDGTPLGPITNIDGASPDRVGQSFEIDYVLSRGKAVAGYTRGHDPFVANVVLTVSFATLGTASTAVGIAK